MNPKIVTAYVPLDVKHLTRDDYKRYGDVIIDAVGEDNVRLFYDFPLERCWLAHEPNLPCIPANPVPSDRYSSAASNVRSNVVQHNRTEWAMLAAKDEPDIDVWVWLDYGIAKQGGWRNNQIHRGHIRAFFDEIRRTPSLDIIPFPGIEGKATVYPTGNNWRFCGSTHIWPVKYLASIDRVYKHELRKWIAQYGTVPLDLPIWALVEQNSHLPFWWYQAEYDASQLTNYRHDFFPGGYQNDPALRAS